MDLLLGIRGGATSQQGSNAPAKKKKDGVRVGVLKNLLATWGVAQVISILANAIRRLFPIAIEPFIQKEMKIYHWVMYAGWFIIMLYSEGYKAFQQKFSPLVVKRAYTLYENPSVMNYLLAGPYSMGLFGATKKRMSVTWSITIGVFAIVGIVKKLPYPYRSIIDAGVVGGLSYGMTSTLVYLIRGMCGKVPDIDPCLPESNQDDEKEGKEA
jgi:hypothetical protein